ncbi:MAG: hypothetical protein RL557_688 [archaeon]
MIVADGITRDAGLIRLPFEEFIAEGYKKYPNPSPAKWAADLFIESALTFLKNKKEIDEQTLRNAFEHSNKQIDQLNKEKNPLYPNIDYLMNDLYGTFGAIACIQKNVLYWGFIGDCGIAILTKEGGIKMRTPDDQAIAQRIRNQRLEKGGIKVVWEQPETRFIKRAVFRNRPTIQGSFGELTGEKEAIAYVKTGKTIISPKDIIMVYSDGVEPFLFENPKIMAQKEQTIKDYFQSKILAEGTIIYQIYNS